MARITGKSSSPGLSAGRGITAREHSEHDLDEGPQAWHHSLGHRPGQAADGQEFRKLKRSQRNWTDCDLQNGWANAGGGFVTAQYCVDDMGRCWVVGRISGGTQAVNTVVVQGLPEPLNGSHVFVIAGAGGAANFVQINSGGNLIIVSAASSTIMNLEFSYVITNIV